MSLQGGFGRLCRPNIVFAAASGQKDAVSRQTNPLPKGRLAPSPTGHLHLGNAYAFLAAWLSMTLQNGKIILRIEDIDPDRSKPEFIQSITNDLQYLGLSWQNPNGTLYLQSERLELYAQAISFLQKQKLIYPCFCTRKELRALASAPHIGDEGVPYPGTCRKLSYLEVSSRIKEGRPFSLRLDIQKAFNFCKNPKLLNFIDSVLGQQNMSIANCGGDFALRRSDGVFAYQLATALDDLLMGVTEIVRGEDLLSSTPRQILLINLLRYAPFCPEQRLNPIPYYAHIPLLNNSKGERLAKRHKDLELRSLWQAGVDPRAVVGYLAQLMGILKKAKPITPQELALQMQNYAKAFLPCLAGHSLIVPDDILEQLLTLSA